MVLASYISPSKTFSFWTILITSGISGIWLIKNVWTLDYNYSFWVIVACIVITALIGQLTFAFINGAFVAMDEKSEEIGYY
jgi:hypothetical protein